MTSKTEGQGKADRLVQFLADRLLQIPEEFQSGRRTQAKKQSPRCDLARRAPPPLFLEPDSISQPKEGDNKKNKLIRVLSQKRWAVFEFVLDTPNPTTRTKQVLIRVSVAEAGSGL